MACRTERRNDFLACWCSGDLLFRKEPERTAHKGEYPRVDMNGKAHCKLGHTLQFVSHHQRQTEGCWRSGDMQADSIESDPLVEARCRPLHGCPLSEASGHNGSGPEVVRNIRAAGEVRTASYHSYSSMALEPVVVV